MKRLFSVPDTDGTSNQLTAAVQVCHTIIASHTRPCGACEDRPGEGWGRTRWEVARQTWGSAEPASMKAPGQHTCWQELIRVCMCIADTLLCSLGCFFFNRLLGPLVLWYINKISIFFLFLKMKSQWQYFVLLVRHLAWEEPHNESGYDDNDTAKSISHHMQKNSWSVGGQLWGGILMSNTIPLPSKSSVFTHICKNLPLMFMLAASWLWPWWPADFSAPE